jgi:hypothetical protein
MPEQYHALAEDGEAGAFQDGKAKMKAHIAAKIAKKGAKFVVSHAVNHVTHGVAGVVFDAPAAISTYQHMQALNTLQAAEPACTCNTCGRNLEYVIGQKNKKLKNKTVGMVPGIGTLNTIKNAIHHFTKTDQGRDRELKAHQLWNGARNGCQKAKAIIAELLGGGQKGLAAAEATIELDNGWEWVKEKMSAT